MGFVWDAKGNIPLKLAIHYERTESNEYESMKFVD